MAISAGGARAEETTLDDFERLDGWSADASTGAVVEVAQDVGLEGMAMRIDFELPPTGGFVLVRKSFPLSLPENYAFRFDLRAEAPQNTVEFKLIDPSRKTVWWRKQRDFVFPVDWQPTVVRKARIEYAWGPEGELRRLGEIELAISTGSGGTGSVWIDNLRFEEREPASAYRRTAKLQASTSLPGHEPERAFDDDPQTSWKSGRVGGDQWLMIDFQKEREYGGLIIDWNADDHAVAYRVETSDDGETWTAAYTSTAGNGERDYVYMPDAESRYVRLQLERSSRDQGYGIASLSIEPFEFSASPNDFYQRVARNAPQGTYPKYFSGRQTYWTLVGVEGDEKEAALNEEGLIEVEKGGFSIEPFLYANGELVRWSSVDTSQELAEGFLPIPTVTWSSPRLLFSVTAFAAGEAGASTLYATYRVENRHDEHQHVSLFLAIRPFQVNPPWQSLNMTGGVSLIREITFDSGVAWVNRDKAIVPLTPADRFGATSFEQGSVTDFLIENKIPPEDRASDPFGFASGAFEYGLDLPPGGREEVSIAIPFHLPQIAAAGPELAESIADVEARRKEATRRWHDLLGHVELDLPPEAGDIANTIRATLAYILINRDGPRLQPGSRNYARSWIRDGALTSAALLEMGFTQEARDFLRWFAPYQYDDGKIPCCVDYDGADPVPEHDSNGQFLFAIAEYYRYTRDIGFVSELWPNLVAAVESIAALRAERSTDVFRTPEKIAFFGLVPESISHEGYSSRPVHSYWDGFFALRGLKDAADLAVAYGDEKRAARFAELRDAFGRDLYASIAKVIEQNQISYIPGSVELADFDPSATAIALAPGGETENLPQDVLERTFDRYWEEFRKRRDGETEWDGFAPYELRNAGAFVRLGERKRALEILEWMIQYQRPRAWHQWPEIVWRDAAAPRFIGDMPHTWIGSGFIQAARSLFAYEREFDRSLVLAAGVPREWVTDGRRVGVKRLPTHYGVLSYTLESERPGSFTLRLSGDLDLPPGGIVLRPPLTKRIKAMQVNGRSSPLFSAREAIVTEFPADVILESEPMVASPAG
ncbi:MAG: discoidin domain-containing protein [Candidatus Binatia bacterium]